MSDSNSDMDISAIEIEAAAERDDLSPLSNRSPPRPHESTESGSRRRAEDESGQRVRRTLETKNVVLVALSVIASAALTAVCNLPSVFSIVPDKLEFGAEDVLSAQLPPVFYLMVFNSAVFAVCLVAVSALLWSLPLGPVVVFLAVAIGVVYAILVKNIMPKISVRVGNGGIEGTYLVGLLALGVICVGAILYCCLSRGCKIIKRAVSKITREFQNFSS